MKFLPLNEREEFELRFQQRLRNQNKDLRLKHYQDLLKVMRLKEAA